MKFYFILFVFFFCVFPFNEAKSQNIEPTFPYKGYATSVTEQKILKTFVTYKEKKNYTEALKWLKKKSYLCKISCLTKKKNLILSF